MIIVMRPGATLEELNAIEERLKARGFQAQAIKGEKHWVIGAVGDRQTIGSLELEAMPGVERVVPIMKPFKLVSREASTNPTGIKVKNTVVGGGSVTVIAGPCAIESREQMLTAAKVVGRAGAKILRGGAFKPRTSPYAFQGLEEKGLEILAEAGEKTGLATVTEVIDKESLDLAMDYVDMVQIGARNMQNFRLLQSVGRAGKPVLLKRGPSATIEEWLMAAEYIACEGNGQIVLCERGIRTFETYTRNTLDLSAVLAVKGLSHLPVLADPCHATGKREMVIPLARAAVALGADGVMVEMHPDPSAALCDGPQSLAPAEFQHLMWQITKMAEAVGEMAAGRSVAMGE